MGFDPHTWIDRSQGFSRALDLERANALGRMDDLALQIGQVDPIGIGDPDRPDTRRCEIEQHRRAETAGPDDEDARLEQAQLTLLADLVEDQVARVTLKLLLAQLHRSHIPSNSGVDR